MMEYDPNVTIRDMTIEHLRAREPMPPKPELLSRDSFDNENRLKNNRYLTQILKVKK